MVEREHPLEHVSHHGEQRDALLAQCAHRTRLVEALVDRMSAIVVGDARAENTQMGPVVDGRQLASNLAALDRATLSRSTRDTERSGEPDKNTRAEARAWDSD